MLLEQLVYVASGKVSVRRVRSKVEALGIRQFEKELYLNLRLDKLVEMVVETDTDAILTSDIAEAVVELAGDPQLSGHQDFARLPRSEDYEIGGAEALQELQARISDLNISL